MKPPETMPTIPIGIFTVPGMRRRRFVTVYFICFGDVGVRFVKENIGWFLKRFSINGKKKYKKK